MGLSWPSYIIGGRFPFAAFGGGVIDDLQGPAQPVLRLRSQAIVRQKSAQMPEQSSPQSELKEVEHQRRVFPESWLWAEHRTGY